MRLSRLVPWVLVAVVLPVPALACPFPGNYVATLTGRLPSGVHFARLALYELTGQCDGTSGAGNVVETFWYWQGDDRGALRGSTRVRVGDVVGTPGNLDRRKMPKGLSAFQKKAAHALTLAGTWSFAGGQVTITWAGGDGEVWRETWRDQALHKLELVGATYVSGSTYLGPGGAREASAETAGWAFGGPGTDATLGVPVGADAVYREGLIRRHNAWCNPPASDAEVYPTGFDVPAFQPTTTGMLRYVHPDATLQVFAYLARTRIGDGVLARRVNFQTSHDFDGDGSIADDLGHTYAGLEIVDASGVLRGFVFADSSASRDRCDEDSTVSAIYYLDAYDCDALYGVDPDTPGECP